MSPVLPDLLREDLDVVFCGSRPGAASAQKGAYYAKAGNKFWRILHEIGLTPWRLEPNEYTEVPRFGIGLTDLGKNSFGQDEGWKPDADEVKKLRRKILRFKPRALAFTSKNAGRWFYGENVAFGRQPEPVGSTAVFVLPSTSGLNGHWSAEPWHELGRFVRRLSAGPGSR